MVSRPTENVVLLAKPGGPHTGVGRYVQMLHQGLQHAGANVARIAPDVPPLSHTIYSALRRLGPDLRTFFLNYPVAAKYPSADVYHLTSQNLASLLLFRRPPGRVIVTVHDIIPYMLRNDPQFNSYRIAADRVFDRLAMAGLQRADLLIADSHYTRSCVVSELGIAPDRIAVVHLGIDQQRFRPLPVPDTLRERYGLPTGRRYLIYVGSEDPRKNLATLVRGLAIVRRELPDIALIKVGRAHFEHERRRLHDLAAELGARSAIHFLDDVQEGDLPLLYNLADVCVMPSHYEGFGFPALEAMACGTPVVCARASSLPEIVGDAALQFEPRDAHALAQAIVRYLTEPDLYQAMRSRSIAQAAAFTWARTTRQTLDLYRAVLPSAGHH
ncbi:MAG TPA: glycosyltransferase family 1 protein [Herpetosiphonaceae bacterium]